MALDRLKLIRVTGLAFLAFLMMLTYSIARPTVEGLFLKAQKPTQLPVVWLLVTLGVVVAVMLYTRMIVRVSQMRLLSGTALASALMLVALLLCRQLGLPWVDYLLYAWKDIYVVLLVEIYYSYTNSVFAIRSARWIYGLLGLSSAVGSLTGSVVVRLLAEPVGAFELLWGVPPILVMVGGVGLALARTVGVNLPGTAAAPSLRDSFGIVSRSHYLTLVLGLIAVTQTVITLVDYQFNEVAERTYATEDQLSAAIATVYGAISAITIGLHAMTGPVLRIVGIPLTLLSIPMILAGGLVSFAVAPVFATIAMVKAASKCFDYSIFRSAKEILYIPLSFEERTSGKFVVDIITYRVAKGGASLLLLGLVTYAAAGYLVTPLDFVLVACWLVLALFIARRFRGLVSRGEEMGPH